MTALQAPSELLTRIRQIWESARTQAARSVNTAHVCANWLIGQQIVEAEQGGAKRAAYGKALLKALSSQLMADYGDGFSVSALQYMRSFFLAYPDLLAKQHALRVVLDVGQIQHAVRGEWVRIPMAIGGPEPCTRACHGRTTARCRRRGAAQCVTSMKSRR